MTKLLTDTYVRSVAPPMAGRLEVSDARCLGLTFRVTSNGVRSWSLRFRHPRTRQVTRATIGKYPEISLQAARDKGLLLRREIAGGVNPVERKREERERASARTFAALAERYMTEHARRHKRTANADQRNLNLHVLPHWRNRPYEAVGRKDVIELCEGVVAKGSPIQANRVQALLSKMFSFAVDAELVSANPCARLRKRSKETAATRVLSDDEVRLFWRQIGDRPNSRRIGQALRLVLLTVVRVTELAGAELKEFDRLDDVENATWTIPASRSKNGRAHVVPLSGLARAVAADLVKRAEVSAPKNSAAHFLLSSPADSTRPIDGHALSVAMIRFGNALGAGKQPGDAAVEDSGAIVTWVADRPSAHDLRRTLATRLAAAGVPAEDISTCLNHKRAGVTARHYDLYDRAREKRQALELWGRQVAGIIDGAWGLHTGRLEPVARQLVKSQAEPPSRKAKSRREGKLSSVVCLKATAPSSVSTPQM
jgi:integrase